MKLGLNYKPGDLKRPIIYDLDTHLPIAYIEKMADHWEANAEFIIRACNAHDELVEVLENLMACVPTELILKPVYEIAEKVLAKAKGETP